MTTSMIDKNISRKREFTVSRHEALNKLTNAIESLVTDTQGPNYHINYDPQFCEAYEYFIQISEAVNVPDGTSCEEFVGKAIMTMMATAHTREIPPVTPMWMRKVDKLGYVIDFPYLQQFKTLALQASFLPPGVERTKFLDPIPIPASGKYSEPPVSPDVIVALVECEYEDPGHTFSYLSGLAVAPSGSPVSFVTGQSLYAMQVATNKFNQYQDVLPECDASKLHLSACVIVESMGLLNEQPCSAMMDDLEELRPYLDKDSSTGYMNFEFYSTVDGVTTKVDKPHKRDVVDAALEGIDYFIYQCMRYLRGEIDEIPDCGPYLEAHKLEIIRRLEYLMGEEITADEEEKMNLKQRFFYICACLRLGLDNMVFRRFCESFRYLWSAIGVKKGGLLEIWDVLRGEGTSPLKKTWEKICKKYEKRGIDLRARRYGEGDWAGYDTRVQRAVLAIAVAIVFSMFNEDPEDPLTRLLAVISHANNVDKVMYMYMMDAFYKVQGRMFSGVLITSTVDTLYQTLLFVHYQKEMMTKYADNEVLIDVLSNWMFLAIFYGDDHVSSWPIWLEQFKLYEDSTDPLDDFVNMCIRRFGMDYKRSASGRYEEDTVVGEIHFFVDEEEQYREVPELRRWGMTFLKYSVTQIHVDGEPFLVPVPMKHPADGPSKLGFSVSASANVSLELAKVYALAHMNTNLEFHQQLYTYSKKLIKYGAHLDADIMQEILDHPDGNSMYMLSQHYKADDLLSFPPIYDVFKDMYETHARMDGWTPLDVTGRRISAEEKQRMWLNVCG